MKRNYFITLIVLLIILVIQSCGSPEEKVLPEVVTSDYIEDSVVLTPYSRSKDKKAPYKFSRVPGSDNVYRSNQPKIYELKYLLENFDIETVIRMNDIEGTGVTIEEERRLVESMGKKFIWINAHLGYKPGEGYVKSLDSIQPVLDRGKALIHCAAGKDRTGYMVARYIKNHTDFTGAEIWEYTTSFNSWKRHVCEGKRGYIKYMEAFYSIEEWKREQSPSCL